MGRVVELITIALVACFCVVALSGTHPDVSELRTAVVERGEAETGAENLVTAIYLGYRAFDTLGETIVLVLAVSGVTVLVREHG